jgi:serine/threonine protein kinase
MFGSARAVVSMRGPLRRWFDTWRRGRRSPMSWSGPSRVGRERGQGQGQGLDLSLSTADPSEIAERIKADLRHRFDDGQRPTAAEYLDRYPQLKDDSARVLSVLYEEYCLLEEMGEPPDPSRFCDRYGPWRDSLASQLRYHRELSQVVAEPKRVSPYPKPGEWFLRYRIVSELGRGGAGRVYLARDDALGGRRLALKVAQDQGEEPRLQGRLDHPHIVSVLHAETEPASGLRALCMPYWPGRPLDVLVRRLDPARTRPRHARAILDALGPPEREDDGQAHVPGETESPGPGHGPAWSDFPRQGRYVDGVAWIGLKLAEALAHAHGRGVMHRDVKPANVLVTHRGGPMLLDFNLAQGTNPAHDAAMAATGGTLPYMAPEQLAAFLEPSLWAEVGPVADLFALGLVLRELLIGERPPTPDPSAPMRRAIADLIEERRRGQGLAVPHGFGALGVIVSRCLAPDPSQRYGSADALAEDLRRALSARPLRHAQRSTAVRETTHWMRRQARPIAAATLVLALAAPVAGWSLNRYQETQARAILDLAGTALMSHDLELAAIRYRKALTLAPDWPQPWEGLALVARAQGRPEEALTAFDRAIERSNSDGPGYLRQLWAQRAGLLVQLSEHSLRASLETHSVEQANAHHRQLRAWLGKVIENFRTGGLGAEHADLEVRAWLTLGDSWSARDSYKQSLECYRTALKRAEVARGQVGKTTWTRDQMDHLILIIKERITTDHPKLTHL